MRLFILWRLLIAPLLQIKDLKPPTLSPDDAASLEGDISNVEIEYAIKAMRSGKAPGPDGLPIEFYKKFAGKLTQVLRELYAEVFRRGSLPPYLIPGHYISPP